MAARRHPIDVAPLAYASAAYLARLFDPPDTGCSPQYKLARLQERLMDRTVDEVRRWVLNTNQSRTAS